MLNYKKLVRRYFKIDKLVKERAETILRQHHFDQIGNTKPEDIFVAGFPKSGNTWMQNLLTGLILNSTSERISPQIVSEIVPDVHAKHYYKRLFNSMIFKTHDLPKKEYRRVIHLVRDGRDAMVSYYKMEKSRDPSYSNTLEAMVLDGKGVYPTKWHLHTREWIKNPFEAELIIVKYEDLLNNPISTLQRISKFIEIEITDNDVMKIYNSNSIEILRKKVVKYGWDYQNKYKGTSTSGSFFRKGMIGNYKTEMPSDLITKFNEEAFKELEHFGYL